MRHSFITLSPDAGAALRDVRDAAGHASADTTSAYDRNRHRLARRRRPRTPRREPPRSTADRSLYIGGVGRGRDPSGSNGTLSGGSVCRKLHTRLRLAAAMGAAQRSSMISSS
ncbi:hypothetical protein AB0L05_22325 [Nonomuraea pusilla]|uniref:hypothetical protein n=1 Tax=Nonomuraea pusilla TaxID=46177 RepID=UPI00332626F5